MKARVRCMDTLSIFYSNSVKQCARHYTIEHGMTAQCDVSKMLVKIKGFIQMHVVRFLRRLPLKGVNFSFFCFESMNYCRDASVQVPKVLEWPETLAFERLHFIPRRLKDTVLGVEHREWKLVCLRKNWSDHNCTRHLDLGVETIIMSRCRAVEGHGVKQSKAEIFQFFKYFII